MTGIWSALMHWALALANTCRLLKLVTLLSCETFGVLIAIIYIKDAVTGFVDYFNDYPADAAFASLLVGLGTFYVGKTTFLLPLHSLHSHQRLPLFASLSPIPPAMTLDGVKQWSLFVKPIRQIIADYAMAIAIIIFAGLSYAGKLEESNMPRLDVPHQFQTTTGRGWYAPQLAKAKIDSSVGSFAQACSLLGTVPEGHLRCAWSRHHPHHSVLLRPQRLLAPLAEA